MIRLLAFFLVFILLLAIQVSFLQSLPLPMGALPLIFVTAVFLTQSIGLLPTILWIPLEGVFLDVMGIGIVSLETVAYGVSAAAVVVTSQRLFTNRSYYGLAATTVLGLLTLMGIEIALAYVEELVGARGFVSSTILRARLTGVVLTMPFLLLLFPLAPSIRRFTQLLLPI